MYNGYSYQQINLLNRIRMLWTQHVYWTRFFILSTVYDLPDLTAVTKRLLENPGDFAQMLTPFFGPRIAGQFQKLFTQHLTIGGDLVNAAKNQDQKLADDLRKKWYQNADEIAEFLSSINHFWDEEMWRSMMYKHLDMTEKEVSLRLQGAYTPDIHMFDRIEQEALRMADYMFSGIVSQPV
ncbi:MAG: acetylglutamate kinase [Lachnospiraceae bacterium]